MDEGMHRDAPEAATFVVVASGPLGTRVTRMAEDRAAFDPDRRRVVKPGDAHYPPAERVARWCGDGDAAALILNIRGELCQRLDPERALVAAWVDDAFLRAWR